jgi:hypothetical protein
LGSAVGVSVGQVLAARASTGRGDSWRRDRSRLVSSELGTPSRGASAGRGLERLLDAGMGRRWASPGRRDGRASGES